MRKLILQLHLWVGLITGAVLAVQGLTGSVYVFQPELTAILYSELYQSAEPVTKPVDPKVIVRTAEEQFDGHITNMLFPLRELENYIVKVKGHKEWHFYDAATGKYLGSMEKRRGVLDTVLEVHRELTLGEIGSTITGLCALLLAVVLVSSGLYLWWPRKKRRLKDGLKFKKNASAKRRIWDTHTVFGIYFSVPLFFAALTGVYFAFSEQVQTVVDFVTLAKEPTPDPEKLQSVYQANAQPLSIFQALDLMEDPAYKGYYKRNLNMPKDSVGFVYFSLTNANDVDAGPEYRPQVYLDQYTGHSIYTYNPQKTTTGRQLTRNWFVPIHFGEVGGNLTRVLWFLLGLMPAILWCTGIIMWQNRRKKSKRKLHVNKIV
ncbi:PepSY-associated TM helix domain-containing protein [Pontibacter vulgaris]|uniref:PepSY-associated TM helix domain-containing protein n=1 Tax=Pontibacter vulgaris TaxID=2905679 RepID=UPI001FA7B020|nr:PepSY-associated TM helix domain-containing protein [Pontibacter vulgaris]